jgi:hypothetical protein
MIRTNAKGDIDISGQSRLPIKEYSLSPLII